MDLFTVTFAYTLARVSLGALLFFQAYDKIVRIGLKAVCDEICRGTSERGIPVGFSKLSVFVSSYIELGAGFLLVIGLLTTPMLILVGVHLCMVIIAFSYLKGVWDMQHVFPRLVLVLLLLLLPAEWNAWSIDALLP